MATETTESSLDELAKGLATGAVSRRKALRWMGGALVGAALASVPGVAWANDDRCSEGQTRCGERCVNLQTNERHCGSCSNRCRSTQTCCKGRCVNLQTNERHCGSCSNRCAEGQECVGGMCQGGGCPSGTTLCASIGVCVPNTTCPPNQTYNPDSCACECPEGDETCCPDCGGVCCPSVPVGAGCYCAILVADGSRICYSNGFSVDSCAECVRPGFCVYSFGPDSFACVYLCGVVG
jgi:hypothetical protein